MIKSIIFILSIAARKYLEDQDVLLMHGDLVFETPFLMM